MTGQKKKKKKKKKRTANLTRGRKKLKPLYSARLVDEKSGTLVDVIHSSDYTLLMVEAMDLAHEKKCSWEIIDIYGRYIDGSIGRR